MAYDIYAPATPTRNLFMWWLQDKLRDPTFSGWTYVDGTLGGVAGVAESAWDAITDPNTEILDEDYIVLHIPATANATRGVVHIIFNADVGVDEDIELRAHPDGWDAVAHVANTPAATLGDTACIVVGAAGVGDVEELRLIADDSRAIIIGMGSGLSPYYFGYLGFIQSFYGAIDGTDDPNPLLVTGGSIYPGITGAPMYMQRIDDVPDTFLTNLNPAGFLATDGSDLLADFQWNRRESPPVPTRVLIPCVIGCKVAGQTEIRGELEGVFFYGPTGTLAEDTVVSRSDGLYVVIDDLILGPVAPVTP